MQAQALNSGTVIDRYAVEGVLGEGGMAIVYQVRHTVLGTRHALKVLTVGNREIHRRLVQEGELQARLQHANIVAVTDVVEVGGAKALVMEFVDGPPLDRLLAHSRLTADQADHVGRGILAGVAHAHAHGLVHRDLKPGNVLLKIAGDGLVPKVADFGLAKDLGGAQSRTRTGSTMGTPHYMSPEQIRDAKNVGPKSDVFALGAILYELVTGRRAFEGEDLLEIFNAVASGTYTHPHVYAPDLPPRMLTAIELALKVDPEQRPATVEALTALWTDGTPAASGGPVVFDSAVVEATRAPVSTRVATTSVDTYASGAPAPALVRASGSLEPRPTAKSSSSAPAVMAAGLGGVVVGGLALAAVALLVGLGVAGWWWSQRTDETPAPQPVAVVAPSPEGTVAPPEPTAVGEVSPEPDTAPDGGLRTAPAGTGDGKPAGTVAPGPVPRPGEPPPDVVASEPEPALEEPEPPQPTEAEPEPAPVTNDEPVPEWTQFLASTSPAERRRGVANLRNRADDESIRLLTRVVREEQLSDIRLDAVEALAWRAAQRRGDVGLLTQGLAVGAGNTEPEALASVQGLERSSTRPDQLRAGLAHPSPRVRNAALDAALAIGRRVPGFDWHPLLDPLTSDRDSGVAKQATAALATLAP